MTSCEFVYLGNKIFVLFVEEQKAFQIHPIENSTHTIHIASPEIHSSEDCIHRAIHSFVQFKQKGKISENEIRIPTSHLTNENYFFPICEIEGYSKLKENAKPLIIKPYLL